MLPKDKDRFSLIQGGSSSSGSKTPDLRVVRSRPPKPPVQLRLPLGPVVLFAGYKDLTFESFVKALDHFRVRSILDIRVSPLFRGRGFDLHLVKKELTDRNIQYIHMPGFNNLFISEHMPSEESSTRYSEYLESQGDLLRLFEKLIAKGPLMLITWSSEPGPEPLVNALSAIGIAFRLEILEHRAPLPL